MQKKRVLGRTGLQVSAIGFGGIPLQGLTTVQADQVLNAALEHGIDFFDSARGYTDSEEKLGRVLAQHRDAIVLATKSMARDKAGISADVETSLRNLGTEMIDLYQLHGIGSTEELERVLGPGGAYEGLLRFQDKGNVRFIGITGHVQAVIYKALGSGLFDTVQIPFNPFETSWLDDVIPRAAQSNVAVIGMKPVAGGALRRVSAALRFSLSQGVDVVIPGMDRIDQVVQNAKVGRELRPPTEAELAELAEERKIWGDRFCRRCGYCMPCGNGLNIPMLLLLQAYYERYHLEAWALERLKGLEKGYEDCRQCGECIERCPYELEIPALIARAADQLG